MKKITIIILIFICFSVSAQFNSSAPWMDNVRSAKNGNATMNELTNSFNQYWLQHDKHVKGSGYKPFMRWQNHWQNQLRSDGTLISSSEIRAAFLQKKAAHNSKNVNTTSAVSNWQPVGPFAYTNTGSWSSGQGRVICVVEDPNNANNVFIGTPAGGIWKSTDAGINFLPLSDQLPQIGVSGIAIDPNDSSTIYISTGDRDATDTYCVGIMKSTDAGLTWNFTGLTFSNTSTTASDIYINPTNSNMLWVATSDGLYKTINAGTSWTKTLNQNIADIKIKPSDPNTVYAVSSNRFYRSTNAGDNFSIISAGLPTSSGRLVIDVTPANSSYVYVLSANTSWGFQGIYKSTNSGTSFIKTSGTTNILESTQGWYDLALGVSSTNPEELYTGCLNVWKSTNGGATSTKINSWSDPASATYTHADIHFLRFYGNKLYCGSDGGVFVSSNQGASFTDLTATAQIGQFYKIAVSKQSSGKMVGGLQDNGGHAYSNNLWKNYYGADGMDTAIDPNNSNLFYGFIQNGGGLYISSNAGNSLSGSVNAPAGEDGNWVTPLAINQASELFSGFVNLYKLVGSDWVQQNVSGLGTVNIDLISIDPNNDNNMFVSIGSELYKSTDKGQHFSSIYSFSDNVSSICVHSSNSNIIYITTRGTSGQTLKSIDGGITFTDFSAGLPAIGKNCIRHQDRNTNNPLFLGTSLGVYYIDDTLSLWEPFDTNLPNVDVTDLEINLDDENITAATFGRGIWHTQIPVQLAATDLRSISINSPSDNINCSSFSPEITIKNNGATTITNVNIVYSINGTPSNYSWTGSLATMQTTNIILPVINMPKGSYRLDINSTTLNDAYSNNNQLSTSFYADDSGTVGVVNEFETTTSELITYDDAGTTPTWQRGICTGGVLDTGTNNVYTTNFSGNYQDGKKGYIVSQCYDLTQISNPQIRFKMAFDIEDAWDVVYVQYSTNSGVDWNILGEMGTNWYNSDRTPQTSGTDCTNCPGAQWTGTDATLTEYSYPLNALSTNPNIIFRIVFQSDGSVNKLGVVVDDFIIDGSLANQEFQLSNVAIYPNPSKGIFMVGVGNTKPKTIEVVDITGKIILSKKDFQNNSKEIPLDLSNVSSGVYFVKIATENQNIVKRIIKN